MTIRVCLRWVCKFESPRRLSSPELFLNSKGISIKPVTYALCIDGQPSAMGGHDLHTEAIANKLLSQPPRVSISYGQKTLYSYQSSGTAQSLSYGTAHRYAID